ncbi:VWA domain-containing protein [Xanthobacter sp. V0B-10]|uniref:VWA domain-containing protein n=1 Tax=Xanthobacter albus TaxID=3119929 RepID=UPI00372A678B
MIPADFHFLRPLWLLALVPALLLVFASWRALRAGHEDWRGVVDAHLLRHLAVRGARGAGRWPLAILLAGWVLASLAMAGPTWQKLPAPALDRLDPTVMVLNLGRSMDATDQAPSRLVAARHKLEDVVARMRGGQVGLIVYADVPFVAAPLTEDGRIIAQMLPELATDLMPVGANRPDLAIAKAVELLQGAGAREGRIVLVTDGLGDDPDKTRAAAAAAARAGYRLSVIGVGTVAGSPLKGPSGIVRGAGGAPVLTRMDQARLTQLAADGRGTFTPLAVDGRDLDAVLSAALDAPARNPLQDSGMTADQWADAGPYLVVVLLVLAPLAFRRGFIIALLLGVLALPAAEARAQEVEPVPTQDTLWADLWRRPDQQGADAFAGGDFAGAAGRFEDPAWKASALYKAGRFDEAASAFGNLPGADYNRGNALARAGKLEEALAAYDAALKGDAANADALFNRDLVQQLLRRRQEEQQKQSGGGGGGQGGGQDSGGGQGGQDKNKADGKSGDGKSGDSKSDAKNEQKPGEGKPGDAKPNDEKSNEGKPQDQKPGNDKPAPGQEGEGKPAPRTPDAQGKNAPAGSKGAEPPQKPEQAGAAQNPPPEPPKAEPSPPQAQPQGPGPQPQRASQVAQPGGEAGEKADQGQPGAVALRPMSEQDQNSEQALRMVPDDPAGLLRARIRAYYGGSGAAVRDDD